MFARLSLCIGLVAGLVGPVHGQDASEADYLAAVLSRPMHNQSQARHHPMPPTYHSTMCSSAMIPKEILKVNRGRSTWSGRAEGPRASFRGIA